MVARPRRLMTTRVDAATPRGAEHFVRPRSTCMSNPPPPGPVPAWAKLPLADMLTYAREHFAHHTDWSLRHRDAGVAALGALLTAEFAVAAFAFSQPTFHAPLAIATLATIAALAVPLTLLAMQSWTQSYKAALEHSALVAKVAWAMGLVHVPSGEIIHPEHGQRPLPDDLTPLFVPRYAEDALRTDIRDTHSFVQWNLTKPGTAFQATRRTLVIMGGAAVCFGMGSAIALWIVRSPPAG